MHFGIKIDAIFLRIFGRVIFAIPERGLQSTRLQLDFNRGAYCPDAPQAAPFYLKKSIL